jgi:hypothetical protein
MDAVRPPSSHFSKEKRAAAFRALFLRRTPTGVEEFPCLPTDADGAGIPPGPVTISFPSVPRPVVTYKHGRVKLNYR